jgi:hypothetical protein
MKTGVELIAEERQEQIEKHGWDFEHDKNHDDGSLVDAAIAIAFNDENIEARFEAPSWAWGIRNHKRHSKRKGIEKIERLKVAGALLAAEIDRLQSQLK